MNFKKRYACGVKTVLCVCLFLISLEVVSEEVKVIYNDKHPITAVSELTQRGILVTLHNLDDSRRLLDEFKKNIAPNASLKHSKKVIMQRFNAISQVVLKEKFMHAYQGVIVSTEYGITRYPAVIFDRGESVIYGVTNLSEALAIYQKWKSGG